MDTVLSETAGFNPALPTLMHIDLNSCFATIEQQANPRLRGNPVAVAAYTSPGGCILAASIEAKRLGIKTGMRVQDGRSLCPALVVLPPDPWKYRFVNRKLLFLAREYCAEADVLSIDEIVLQFAGSPYLNCFTGTEKETREAMQTAAREIKNRIKREIGEWLTVSVGIASNRYLAKIASGLHKPDGLDEITKENIEEILKKLALEELCGIKKGYASRLRCFGIHSALDFYRASIGTLRLAFRSITGHHWWMRLHGWEADDRRFGRKSFGHSYALYTPLAPGDLVVRQILCQLVEKMGFRLRANGYKTQGIHVSTLFSDYSHWHHGQKLQVPVYAGSDLYKAALEILATAPEKPIRILSVTCFNLVRNMHEQLMFFENGNRKQKLTHALDTIAMRWGDGTLIPGRMLSMPAKILDRIAFGGVAGLEEFVYREPYTYEPDEN